MPSSKPVPIGRQDRAEILSVFQSSSLRRDRLRGMARSKPKPATRKKPKLCVFCDRTGVTKEHIWSDWVNKILPGTALVPHHQVRLQIRQDHKNKIATVQPLHPLYRQGGLTQRTIRNVCAKCNSGWMSEIVERAKVFASPMIQNQPCEIPVAAQRDLAAWIAMAAIMAEFTDEMSAAIPESDRKIMQSTESPPPTWTICVGRYAGARYGPVKYRHYGFHVVVSLTPGPIRLAGAHRDYVHVTTYVLGGLVVHAFSSTNAGVAAEFRRDHAPGNMVRIWPAAEDTVACPLSAIGDDDVDFIHDRIFNSMGGPREVL